MGDQALNGSHVLIIDDTWTSGGHAQSLALTARAAGARTVTIVVIARWLDTDWPATAGYLEGHPRRDFNPRICPVTGNACP
jgi:adenine/guanine phosphoribosyltransferase-like PRPP-binding protein